MYIKREIVVLKRTLDDDRPGASEWETVCMYIRVRYVTKNKQKEREDDGKEEKKKSKNTWMIESIKISINI